jgi:hydroxyacylglutathione hydrolase
MRWHRQNHGFPWKIPAAGKLKGQIMTLKTHQFPYGSDNYGLLLHSDETGLTACVDAGDADATRAALAETGWGLTHIFITHHHADHTEGLADLKTTYNATVLGPKIDSAVSNLYDMQLGDGDHFEFAGRRFDVLTTPGHTLDMINFYSADDQLICTGDTLFVLGCGRIFEGDAAMMWASLEKLMALPDDTIVYCSHEYTLANARFAVTIDPDNTALAERQAAFETLRENNLPTVPTRMDLEKATNPFLRASDPAIRAHLAMTDASDADVFAEIRRRKDNF